MTVGYGPDAVWLVKSGDRILGPFTDSELVAKLQSREIVVIDEVARPTHHWRYIRDEPQLAKVVEAIRRSQLAQKEDTDIQTTTETGTAEITQIIEDSAPSRGEAIREVPSHSARDSRPVKTYVFESDRRIQETAQGIKKLVWLFAIAFVGMIGLSIWKLQQPKPSAVVTTAPTYEDMLGHVLKNYKLGEYAEALRFAREASQLRAQDPDLNIIYAPLLIQIEGQATVGKRLLQEILTTQYQPEYTRPANVALGLAALNEEDMAEARRYFETALKGDSNFVPALYNLGSYFFRKGSWGEARSYLRQAVREDPQLTTAAFLLARTEMALAQQEGSSAGAWAGVRESFRPFVEKGGDYSQESLVFMAYAVWKLGHKDQAKNWVQKALDADPYLTEEHVHSLLLDLKILDWANYVSACQEVADGLGRSAQTTSLKALCAIKSRQLENAQKWIEDAIAQQEDESLVQATNSYILMRVGREAEARAALSLAQKDSALILPKILRARMCSNVGDGACAVEIWRSLVTLEPPVLSAVAGLAAYNLKSNENEAAKNWFKMGRTLSPSYRPLLKLADQVEGLK